MSNEDQALDGPEFIPQGEINSMVILLHGLGSNGQDLYHLVPELKNGLESTAFLSPNAPFHCDMAPIGYQWFSLRSWEEHKILEGIKIAAPILERYIKTQAVRFSLPLNKVALLGFSQGTMMSLYVAPRLNEQLAGVVGFSGANIGGEELKDECQSKPPVQLIHGTFDPVVPFDSMAAAMDDLEAVGLEVRTMACEGIAHGISPRGLNTARQFLEEQLLSQI